MVNDVLFVGVLLGIWVLYWVDMSEFDSIEDLINDSSFGRYSDGDVTSGDDVMNKFGMVKFL